MKKRILFVGEDQPLWQEFENHSISSDGPWMTDFAGTGQEALILVDQKQFDAVVVDVQLSGMSGIELLDRIMVRQPKALRVIISDIEDAERTVKCVGKAHQHLLKPCDALMVSQALHQALTLQSWLPGENVRELISRMRWVPSPPGIYAQIVTEMQSMDASVEKIGKLIAQDPAITAKILQLANSAAYALQLQVVEPVEAVSYIGLETTKALVLLAHTFSSFDRLSLVGFSVESLWDHSVATGQFAKRIAIMENAGSEIAEESFAGGLLHDIGKLLFAANLSEPFGQALALARAKNERLWEIEAQLFGASHAEVGACVLGIWGLPMPIVKAVALHHYPARHGGSGFSPLTAVHVANVLDHETRGSSSNGPRPELDPVYLKQLGLDQKVEDWRRHCLDPSEEATA
jgi:HD-like signal output (HDOD) protein/CheY-like chemotaxis protein